MLSALCQDSVPRQIKQAGLRVLRYLKGAKTHCLVLGGAIFKWLEAALEAWSDADWAGDVSDTKSTSGYIVKLQNPPSAGELSTRKHKLYQ
jgi:hypothetical protein